MGIWDSITVIIDRGIPYNAFGKLFSLALYSAAIYTVIGCLGMVAIGAISGIVIKERWKAMKREGSAGKWSTPQESGHDPG